jgi:hypothetical protein
MTIPFRLGHAQIRLLAWLALFGTILAGRYQRYYLAGWNVAILGCGTLFLALLFVAGLLGTDARGPRGKSTSRVADWLQTSTHFIPLLLFVIVGPSMPNLSTMNVAAFMARPTKAMGSRTPVRMPGSADYLSVSLLDLHFANERYEGERIEVLGRVHVLLEDELRRLPPAAEGKGIRVIVYRYVITCCVADATPVSAVLQGIEDNALQEDEWYKIRGRAHYVAEGLDVPFIAVETADRIAEPINPYLSAVEAMFR